MCAILHPDHSKLPHVPLCCCRSFPLSFAPLSSPPLLMTVQLDTSHGALTIRLYCKETPRTCRNFIELAKHGYYDGIIFHVRRQRTRIRNRTATADTSSSCGVCLMNSLMRDVLIVPFDVVSASFPTSSLKPVTHMVGTKRTHQHVMQGVAACVRVSVAHSDLALVFHCHVLRVLLPFR